MDATQAGILIASVSAAVSGVLTLVVTKGIDGWLKLRADKRIDDTREEQSANEVLMFTIQRQDHRIEKLENELRAVYEQHNECERKYAALSTRLDRLDGATSAVKDAVSEVKPAIRDAVHDVKDALHGASLKAQEAAKEAKPK